MFKTVSHSRVVATAIVSNSITISTASSSAKTWMMECNMYSICTYTQAGSTETDRHPNTVDTIIDNII